MDPLWVWVSSATRGLPNSTQTWLHYLNDWALGANHPPLHNAPASCPPSILHRGCLGCQVTQRWGHQQLPLSWSTGCTVVLAPECQTLLGYSQSSLKNTKWRRWAGTVQSTEQEGWVCGCTPFQPQPSLWKQPIFQGGGRENEVNSILIHGRHLLVCFGENTEPEPPPRPLDTLPGRCSFAPACVQEEECPLNADGFIRSE